MLQYTLKRSKRTRYMRLSVQAGGSVVLTVPHAIGVATIERFLARHAEWIERSIGKMRDRKTLPVRGRRAYLKYKEEARRIISARVRYWNRTYGYQYGRIAIKDTSSLWGSCSRKGNLNFSYKLIFLPEELQEYVVVHELCHLAEPNHSRTFWALVEKAQPEYVRLRRELRRYLLQ
jgi:predicted metal-dependent hydrolase